MLDVEEMMMSVFLLFLLVLVFLPKMTTFSQKRRVMNEHEF